jgi:hypothetical protein
VHAVRDEPVPAQVNPQKSIPDNAGCFGGACLRKSLLRKRAVWIVEQPSFSTLALTEDVWTSYGMRVFSPSLRRRA